MLQDQPQEVCAWQCAGSGLAGAGSHITERHLVILIGPVYRARQSRPGSWVWRPGGPSPSSLGHWGTTGVNDDACSTAIQLDGGPGVRLEQLGKVLGQLLVAELVRTAIGPISNPSNGARVGVDGLGARPLQLQGPQVFTVQLIEAFWSEWFMLNSLKTRLSRTLLKSYTT